MKNWWFWTMVLEKTLESPLDYKEIQPVHPKGNQSWVFTGRTDVEAETPILWPPDLKSWLILKDPDAGKDWGQKEKGTTEVEMVRWHHWLNGHGFGQTLAVGDGQGGLACCRSWCHKESDMTERLNWTIWPLTEHQAQCQGFIWALLCCTELASPVWLFATLLTGLPGSYVHGDFPSKSTGVGCHFLLQGIYPPQESNPWLLHWQEGSLPLATWEDFSHK